MSVFNQEKFNAWLVEHGKKAVGGGFESARYSIIRHCKDSEKRKQLLRKLEKLQEEANQLIEEHAR